MATQAVTVTTVFKLRMTLNFSRVMAASALLTGAAVSGAATAGTPADIEQVRAATARLISQLVEQGVLNREAAAAMLNDVGKPGAAVPMAAAQTPQPASPLTSQPNSQPTAQPLVAATPAAPLPPPTPAPVAMPTAAPLVAPPPPAAAAAYAAPAAPTAVASADPAAGQNTAGGASKAAAGTVRVPYIPEFMRKELKEEIRLELAAQAFREGWSGPGSIPSWVRSLEWEGDLRLRAQFDRFANDNAETLSVGDTNRNRSLTLLNVTQDRDRMRFRGRIGLNAKIDSNWSGGVRLTTGSATDPLSSNQTLGNFNNRYTVLIDRAYIRYKLGDEFNAVAGRFGNPWFGTDLLWANDLSFDGAAVQWTPQITPAIRGFVTAAAMPVQEVELSSADKWLFGAQVGATMPSAPSSIGGKVGLGFYRYLNMTGKLNAVNSSLNDFTAPAFTQKGNTYFNISSDVNRPLFGLASEYRLFDLTGQVDFPSIGGKRVILTGDYVHNFGFDRREVSARLGQDVEGQVDAWHLRAVFGNAEVKSLHDWQVSMAYKRIERDAVLDAFTDSDFRLGGTDAKGFVLGGSYGLGKNTAAAMRFFSGDAISGPPLSIDVLQFDLNVRF
jgi:Putative porin